MEESCQFDCEFLARHFLSLLEGFSFNQTGGIENEESDRTEFCRIDVEWFHDVI